MKTRIISATVALVYFALVLALVNVAPIVLIFSICALTSLAIWEMLHETKLVQNKLLVIGCCVYAFVTPFLKSSLGVNISYTLLILVLALYLIVVSLANHSKTSPKEFAASLAFTVIITYAFISLMMLINNQHKYKCGLLYLLLACCFAWGSDTGAYFTGVFFGKHKLAPVLSPKKTVEGAVGGVVFCTLLSFLVAVVFNKLSSVYYINVRLVLIISPFFSVLGIIGDLFASYIKRSCNIKDYGKIMPGHGGVLDRFDSLLLISPVFWVFLNYFPII